MNEEKTMILTMLKEGKISVEEAESLLAAVGDESNSETKNEKEDLKIDFEGMKAGLKSGIKEFTRSMEGTLKSAMEGIKSLDLGNVVSSAFGSAKASSEKELILSATDITGLSVRTGSGDLVVTGGDTADILIQAEVTARGSDEENAQERADEIDLVTTVEDGTLKITDSGSSKQITGPYRVDYRITVPQHTDVSLQTMDGDITVKSIDGATKVSNYSGDVHLKNCENSIKIKSKSGDIDVEEFAGSVSVSALSGDLTFREVKSEDFSCNTLSGDISGSIMPKAGSNITAKTLSGDIELEIPESSTLSINADTLSGDIECDLPVRDAEKKGHRFTAILNEPDGEMVLATKSGDINLSAATDNSGE